MTLTRRPRPVVEGDKHEDPGRPRNGLYTSATYLNPSQPIALGCIDLMRSSDTSRTQTLKDLPAQSFWIGRKLASQSYAPVIVLAERLGRTGRADIERLQEINFRLQRVSEIDAHRSEADNLPLRDRWKHWKGLTGKYKRPEGSNSLEEWVRITLAASH